MKGNYDSIWLLLMLWKDLREFLLSVPLNMQSEIGKLAWLGDESLVRLYDTSGRGGRGRTMILRLDIPTWTMRPVAFTSYLITSNEEPEKMTDQSKIFSDKYQVDLDTGCWNWIRSTNANGYGTLKANGKNWLAHRYSWFLTHGVDPDLHVCHHCDNTLCVNPQHLFIGTDADNKRDCVMKGRTKGAIGERNTKAKLTRQQVTEIRELLKLGIKGKDIAFGYGVTPTNISDIKLGHTWIN